MYLYLSMCASTTLNVIIFQKNVYLETRKILKL